MDLFSSSDDRTRHVPSYRRFVKLNPSQTFFALEILNLEYFQKF